MAENENRNNVNPTITINNGGAGLPQGESAVLPILVEFIRQSGLNHQEIKDLLSNISNVPANADFASLSDDVKKSLSKSINAAKNAILKKIEGLSVAPAESGVDNSAAIAKLQESLDRIEDVVAKGLKSSATAERATGRELKKLVASLDGLHKKVDELLARGAESGNNGAAGSGASNDGSGNDGAGNGGAGNNGNNGAGNDGNGGSGAGNNGNNGSGNDGAGNDGAGNNGSGNDGNGGSGAGNNGGASNGGSNNGGSGNNGSGNNGAGNDGSGNDGNGGSGAGNNGGAGTNPPNPPSKPKLKKLRFVQKSLQQTKMLAEAKQPWYKRLATFAIKHPVLSVVAGAGLGLGLFGATCGIAALAGGTGFLTAANMLLPSLPGVVGVGALGGGTVSLTSNTLPKGQWGLYAKAGRLFGKVKKIDRTKQWVASFEKQQEAAKEAARERHRNSKGLIRKLKVHRVVAKAHKLAERTSRKVRRLYERRLVKTTSKALETKNKLNTKEIKSDRTQALAGYLQKKKRAENKFAKGKLDEEDFAERIADLEEDYADLDGGAPGLSEVPTSKYYTFDTEALEAIKVADASGKNSAFQTIKQDILTRNSVETRSIGTKVVHDPEYIAQLIEEEKKKGNADKVKELTEMHKKITDTVAAAEADARAAGIEGFEALVDLTDEELAQIEQEQQK